MSKNKKKITPYLWFDNQAEEAMNFYLGVFRNSKVVDLMRFGSGGPGPEGSLMSAKFELEGQEFMILNGGPQFAFSEATSFYIECESQKEIDDFWDKLTAGGGEPGRCGWLKDKFGVSWQVIPAKLDELLTDKDSARVQRVMKLYITMDKIDLKKLEQA